MGEEEQLRGRQGADDGEHFNGTWARIFGWTGHHDGGRLGVYSDQGPTFDYDLAGLQAGVDIYRREHDDGKRDHAGAYVAFGRSWGTVYHINDIQAGSDQVDAVSLGGYWTHFWKSGSYLDVIVQRSWYSAKAQSADLPALKGNGAGWALSLEGGRPFAMKGNWVLEPQAQLTYQTFDKISSSDAGGLITFEGDDSLVGRLGLRAAKTWIRDDADKLETTGWLRLNLLHEFMGQPTTVFQTETGPLGFEANLGGYWAELNAGLTKQLSRLTTVYGGGRLPAQLRPRQPRLERQAGRALQLVGVGARRQSRGRMAFPGDPVRTRRERPDAQAGLPHTTCSRRGLTASGPAEASMNQAVARACPEGRPVMPHRSFKSLLLAGCLIGAPAAAAAQDYTGGQLNNFNGTYNGTIRITTSGGSAFGVNVSSAAVTTNLLGDVAISPSGGSFAHGIRTTAGAVNLSGTILITTNSVAGSGVRAEGGVVTLTQGAMASPVTINLTTTGGSSNPPDEAAGLYNQGGVITVNGDYVTKEDQIRSYGLWNLSTQAAGLTVNGNVQVTTTNRESFGIRQDQSNTKITGNTTLTISNLTASPGVRAAAGSLTFGGDLTIKNDSASGGILRPEAGYGLWNTSASGASGIVDDVGANITVGGTTTIVTTGTAGIGVYNDSVSGTFTFNGPVGVTTSGGTAASATTRCRRPGDRRPSAPSGSTRAAVPRPSTRP